MASITLHRSGIQVRRIDLNKFRTTLGHGDADIQLDDPNFPPILAQVREEAGGHRVIASKGHLLGIGGELVEDALLEDGEEVSFGSYGFVYEREAVTDGAGEVRELGDLVSRDPRMHRLFERIRRVAALDIPVLIRGETGTGKELVANAVHRLSRRAAAPFVALNCGGMAGQLITSELFGHEAGAFTGALAESPGAFACAHTGTIFLDEIGEMPPDAQAHLLRVAENGEVRRVGANRVNHVDTRIIAATHRNLPAEVDRKRFRLDLYYRLSVAGLDLPPLRQRRCDIPLLWDRLVARLDDGRRLELSPRALQKLLRHAWPGNIRELRNVAQRAVIHARDPVLSPKDIRFDATAITAPETLIDPEGLTLTQLESEGISHALMRTGGNVEQAARKLGVTRALLRRRMDGMECGEKASLARTEHPSCRSAPGDS